GTVRVRLHRARLFVRKELMRVWQQPGRRRTAFVSRKEGSPKPARCKDMFAELSNYLDEQLDDSLCEELEHHLDGCAPCKAFLASLEEPMKRCRRAPADPPPRAKPPSPRQQLARQYRSAAFALRTIP